VGRAPDKARLLERAERSELLIALEEQRDLRNEWLRRAILDKGRVDILAREVLGLQVLPFHTAMIRHQHQHPNDLQLVFRGAGKTTTCTITRAIYYLCKNRNFRILLASKTKGQSEAFLKEIKAHLEGNQRLIEIFGPFYDPQKTPKWDNGEIEVLGRTVLTKESSITCVGVDSAIVSKHYDAILADDLVDEENSRTEHMRQKVRTWYYQTLDPTLEPPDPSVPHRGDYHRLGTRYHYDDLWGHLMENELKDHTQVIPALDPDGRSPWPEKYPAAWFKEKRRNAGTIIFNAQYQCDTEAMKGEIFKYDDCQELDDKDWPDESGLRKFVGVDLAIKESETTDQFAIVCVGISGSIVKNNFDVFILDYFAGQLRFNDQTKKILDFYNKWDPITGYIESNAYQLSQFQNIKHENPGLRIKPKITDKDKVARAWKLSPLFEDKRVFFKKGVQNIFIDQLVLFPSHRYKDLFDALDMAVAAAKNRGRRRREGTRKEPGLI
jgi:phage terminase large subunit-like protein